MPMTCPRVALFTDSYYEANGVARTAQALEAYAAGRERPLMVVHGGPASQTIESGSIVRFELERSRATSFALEHDLLFDLALWRHVRRLRRALQRFRPDVIHLTGPSDVGLIGAYLACAERLPIAASWHTNLHEYASRRLSTWLPGLRYWQRAGVAAFAERHALTITMLFYRLADVTLAPTREWADELRTRLRKRTFIMTRGIDTTVFSPAHRQRADSTVNVGYVGRLSAEKSVRSLAAVAQALADGGCRNVRFTVVGNGSEREWLRQHIPGVELTGVLRGAELSTAYANMDLFVFPSETETVGNVILEAMASGVPVVAMARGGPKSIASGSRGAVLARSQRHLVELALRLARDPETRREMATAAREDALTRSWSAVFDTVYAGYASAVAAARGQAGNEDGTVAAAVEGQA